MANRNYKKYMKQGTENKDYNLIKLFIISFCGLLLFFIFIIKFFAPPVDVSIGDNNKDNMSMSENENIDGRLSALQAEDNERSFSDIVSSAIPETKEQTNVEVKTTPVSHQNNEQPVQHTQATQTTQTTQSAVIQQPVYKVYIGSYTSSEQAKVARDIIQDTGGGLTPIVKCIGSNNYTLQVGIFKNKTSAETLLYSIQQNHLPGRIVQEY